MAHRSSWNYCSSPRGRTASCDGLLTHAPIDASTCLGPNTRSDEGTARGKAALEYSAVQLARAIAGREVTACAVVEAHLARIEAVNPRVNAVVRVLHEEAPAAALVADKAVEGGGHLGPLHGVPFTIKENIDVAGLPTTWGVPALAQAVVPVDAPVVERANSPTIPSA